MLVLGWTRPKLRDPAAADRWTWLILACYAQLRLAIMPCDRMTMGGSDTSPTVGVVARFAL
jgi:hypothetical protein